jgi:hypothetical protein
MPLVVSDPTGPVGRAFMELGAAVVREVAKMGGPGGNPRNSVTYDEARDLVVIKLAGRDAFAVAPAAVRAADTSAAAIDEWTGERVGPAAVPQGVKPAGVSPVGNYAVQVGGRARARGRCAQRGGSLRRACVQDGRTAAFTAGGGH